MNRYASIQEGVVHEVCNDLLELHGKMQHGDWAIKDGLLHVTVKGADYLWEFEKGDPTSEAILLMLKHLPYMLDVLRNKHNEILAAPAVHDR